MELSTHQEIVRGYTALTLEMYTTAIWPPGQRSTNPLDYVQATT